jgi:hypothetical protein
MEEGAAIGQIGHSLIPMGLAVLKNQDWVLYGIVLDTQDLRFILLEDLWKNSCLNSLFEILIILPLQLQHRAQC